MKAVAIVLAALSLSGCGAFDRFSAYVTGSASYACMDGVLYYQFTSGAALAVDQAGKPRTCGE